MNSLDFLNSNSLRNYPLADGVSRVSSDSLFVIPNTLIVDMSLCAAGNDSETLYISRIINNSTNLIIEISALDIGVFGTFTLALPNSGTNFDIILTAAAAFPGAVGMLTIGTTEELTKLPYGEFTFSATDTRLLMRVYSAASVSGLNWLKFNDTRGNSATYTGYVTITANSNVKFRDVTGTLYIDAGENLGLNKICEAGALPVRTINGVTADPVTGDFTFVADQCISFDTAQYGLVMSDSCGKPCLGCEEIEQLTNQLNALEASILDMVNFANNLQSAVTQTTTLLGYNCEC